MSFKYELGVTLKDIVTGFTGAVTGRADYLTGCNQYMLKPKCEKHDEMKKCAWLDENQLEETKAKKIIIDTVKVSGGPQDHPNKD